MIGLKDGSGLSFFRVMDSEYGKGDGGEKKQGDKREDVSFHAESMGGNKKKYVWLREIRDRIEPRFWGRRKE